MRKLYTLIAIQLLLLACEAEVIKKSYPTVSTIETVSNGNNKYFLTGHIDNPENYSITEYGFIWGISENINLNSAGTKKIIIGQNDSLSGEFHFELDTKGEKIQTVRVYVTSPNFTVYGANNYIL